MSAQHQFTNPRWPNAVWDVSGAFAFDRELLSFFDFCQKTLGIEKIFPIVHGAPLITPWNSGRVIPAMSCSVGEVEAAIIEYAKRQISLYLTFSNTLLTEKHMDNAFSNNLCEAVVKLNPSKKNAAIISSDLLNEHIKKYYPSLKRINSILKITKERGRANLDIYQKYLEEFDEVMVHPDDVINLEFLQRIPQADRSRCILLVNEYCIRNCPIRQVHYESLSMLSLDPSCNDTTGFPNLQPNNGCLSIHHALTHPKHGVLAQSIPEMEALYAMGFTHFKLQGRGLGNAIPQLFNLILFTLRNDLINENTMQAITQRFWESLDTSLV